MGHCVRGEDESEEILAITHVRCVKANSQQRWNFVTLVNLENHLKLTHCLGLATDAIVPWLLPGVTVIAQSAQCAPCRS